MAWIIVQFAKVEEFLFQLPENARAKASSDLVMLRQYGPFLKQPFSKKITKDLFELRIKGKNSTRIFYTFSSNRIYLLHAFRKKSQKIPPKEIKVALDRMKQLI